MAKLAVKSLNKPDEVRTFAKGKVELVNLGGVTVGGGPSSRGGNGRSMSNPWPKPRVAWRPIFSTI